MTTYKNTTPWNTADLQKLVDPLAQDLDIETITFKTATPMPGVRTEEQRQAEVCAGNYGSDPKNLTIELLSPKRAGKRSEALDRLSLIEDLKPHEAALPEKAVATIEHAFETLRRHRSRNAGRHMDYEVRNCMVGACNCKKAVKKMVLVRGDTKAATKPPVTVEVLERKLSYAEADVACQQKHLTEAMEKRDRLLERLERLRAKQTPAMSG